MSDIALNEPVPGYFVLSGHKPQPVFITSKGWLVPPNEMHVPPEVPTEFLERILMQRKATTPAPVKRGRGRPSNAERAALAAQTNEQQTDDDFSQ